MLKKLLVLTAAAGISAGAIATVPAFAAKGGGSGTTTSTAGCDATASIATLIKSSTCFVAQNSDGTFTRTTVVTDPNYLVKMTPDPRDTPVKAGTNITYQVQDPITKVDVTTEWGTSNITCFTNADVDPRMVMSSASGPRNMDPSVEWALPDRKAFAIGYTYTTLASWTEGPVRCELALFRQFPGTKRGTVVTQLYNKVVFNIYDSDVDLVVDPGRFGGNAIVTIVNRWTRAPLTTLPEPLFMSYGCGDPSTGYAVQSMLRIPVTGAVMSLPNYSTDPTYVWPGGSANCGVNIEAARDNNPDDPRGDGFSTLGWRFYTVAA